MSSFFSIVILFFTASNALDCSQYQSFESCTSDTAYCQWSQSLCRCASPVNLDILFTVSTSMYIGESNFNNLLKSWLTTVAEMGINTGVSNVGFNVFSDMSTLTPISKMTHNEMADAIYSIRYDGGVADLAVALDTALMAFGNNTKNDHSRQKINIIVMATNPYKEGTTSSEVCGHAATMKQAGLYTISMYTRMLLLLITGIKNVFIGIGSQWNEARIDCLVEDVNTDIIHIPEWTEHAFNASLAYIYPFLCSVDPKIKITEIKTSQFIEFINLGIEIDETMQLNFDGLVKGNVKNLSIPQGSYGVLYNGKDGSLSCSDCNAVFVECDGSKDQNCEWNPKNMNNENFNLAIKNFDEVSYSKNSYWPSIGDSKSYSLEYIGYNNQFGANYVGSCDTAGTPGADTQKCTSSQLKCTLDTDCSLSGDTSAYCNAANGGVCVCGNGFYLKDNTCYPIPTPSDCIAYIVKNGTQRYTRFEWTAAEIDSDQIEYGIRYYQTGFDDNQMVTVLDVSRIRNEDDLYDGVKDIAGYAFTRITDENSNEYDSAQWTVNCSVKSQAPTSAPTSSPSDSPTFAPSDSPTSAPTWSIPKVFLNGEFCDQDRCECFEQDFDCCLNDTTLCEQQELSYIVGNDDIFQTIKIFPEAFPYEAEIKWKVKFNGTVGGTLVNPSMNDSSLWNPLGVSVYPMNGSSKINGSTNVNIELTLNQTNLTDILCTDNGTKCISEYSLSGLQAVFVFEVLECAASNGENGLALCDVVYPNELVMYVERSDIGTLDGGGGGQDKVPTWVWIVLAAGLALLALLSWLMYRYWWKGKVQDSDYQVLTDDVEFQKVQNEQDFETNLNANKDVAFNPLATGMPGVDKNNDPLTAEVERRDKMQRNEMIEQDAEKQVFKEDMGQVAGKLNNQ